MLFAEHLIIMRGGGDLGTGAAYRLHQAGFPLVVLEREEPLAIRRAVAVAAAVDDGVVEVEGMTARLADSVEAALGVARTGDVAVVVAPSLPAALTGHSALVDARLAKRNIDTRIDQAELVIGLGPGFTAGDDCHAVVETMRGPHLGRVIRTGQAQPDTGVPGAMGGESARRVVRAHRDGRIEWEVAIGDHVSNGDTLGAIDGTAVAAEIGGVVRGLIAAGRPVHRGLKIADIDPRGDRRTCFEISDKALAVGGGVLEAVLAHLNQAT